MRGAGPANTSEESGALILDNGKLEKMLILAFETSADAESSSRPKQRIVWKRSINPETYTLE